MRNFVLGGLAVIVAQMVVAGVVIGFGLVPMEASQQPSAFEARLATHVLDTAVQRRPPKMGTMNE